MSPVDDQIMETLRVLAPKVRPGSKDVCKKGCKECESLQDLSGIFRAIGMRLTPTLTRMAVHFLEANGHDKSATWKFSSALNLAFSVSLVSAK